MTHGCHSDKAPTRLKHHVVWHSSMRSSWLYAMTRECQYSKDVDDAKCDGCKQKETTLYDLKGE